MVTFRDGCPSGSLMKQNPRHQVTGPVGAEEPQGSMGTNTLTLVRASRVLGVTGKRGWEGKERNTETERNSCPRKQNKEAYLKARAHSHSSPGSGDNPPLGD